MKHRVGALVVPVADKMWVSTFHSAWAESHGLTLMDALLNASDAGVGGRALIPP